MSRLRAVVVTAATLIGVTYLVPSDQQGSAPESAQRALTPRTADVPQQPVVTPPKVASVTPAATPSAPRTPEAVKRPPVAAPQPGIHPVTIAPKPPGTAEIRKVELPPEPPSVAEPPKPQRVYRKQPATPVDEKPAEQKERATPPPRASAPSKSDPVRRITITANPNAAPAPRDGETGRPLAPERPASEPPPRPDARSPVARSEAPSWETRVIQPRRPEKQVAEKRPDPPQPRAQAPREPAEQLPNVLRLGQAPQAGNPQPSDRSQLPRPMLQAATPGRPEVDGPRVVAAPPVVGTDPRTPAAAPQTQTPQAQAPQPGVRTDTPAKPKVTAQRYTPSYYVGATNRRPTGPVVVYPSRGNSSVSRGGRVFFGNSSRNAP